MVRPVIFAIDRVFAPSRRICVSVWTRIVQEAIRGEKPDIKPLVEFFRRLLILVDLKTRERLLDNLRKQGVVKGFIDPEANKIRYEEPWIRQAFTLSFEEALNAFASKIPALEATVKLLDPFYKNRAFWVAGIESLRIIREIKELLLQRLANTITTRELETRIEELTRFGRYRVETLWRTNIQTAYGSGLWGLVKDHRTEGLFPFYEYNALTGDPSTRKTHETMDGFIAVADDRVWDKIWIPNGFSCRCSIRPISRNEAQARGLLRRDGVPVADRIFASLDQKKLVEDGYLVFRNRQFKFPDPGFESNPGQALFRR